MHRNRSHKMRMGIIDSAETTLGLDIKDPHRPIITGTDDEVARRVDQNTSHPILVRIERHKARRLADRPKPDRAVSSAGCHQIVQLLGLLVGRALSAVRPSTCTAAAAARFRHRRRCCCTNERQCLHHMLMTAQLAHPPPITAGAVHIDDGVVPAGREHLSVRFPHRHRPDPVAVVRQRVDAEARLDVPKLHGLVAGCRHQMGRPGRGHADARGGGSLGRCPAGDISARCR